MSIMEHHIKKIKEFGSVKQNEALSKHTTFKIGGNADVFVTVTDTEKLVNLLKFLLENDLEFFILGGGSNMLVSDEGFRGVVINIKTKHIVVDDNLVIADAGCITVEVAQKSIAEGLTGFEWGIGVPGTIGGALRGNAGAMGGEMKDSVEKIDVYYDGEVTTWTNEECGFGYRSSILKKESGVILRVYLRLKKTLDKKGMKKALDHLKYRNSTQPQGYASTGCIFKNVDVSTNKDALLKHFVASDEKVQQFLKVGKISAGWLVEQAGMKGASVGKAEISERHGNFIINKGGATASDVVSLIDEIKQAVYDKFGIELEEEIQIIK